MSMRAATGLRAPLAARPVQQQRHAGCRAAASRETWYPGAEPPAYLDGTYAGDRGFDPLRMAANPDTFKWYREAELYNGRFAMMGVTGMLFTDLVGLPVWYEAGAKKYALDNKTLLFIELATFAVFEYKRWDNFQKKGQTGLLGMAPFDPAGLNSEKMQEREIKNARLAMIAFLGMSSQAAVRGGTPISNLKDHMADPGHVNICTSKVGVEATAAVCALMFTPIVIEAFKRVGSKDENSENFKPIPW